MSDSEISEADPGKLLSSLKDLDDLDADLFSNNFTNKPIKRSSEKGTPRTPRTVSPSVRSHSKTLSAAQTEQTNTASSVTKDPVRNKGFYPKNFKPNSNLKITSSKSFDEFDEDDPLAGLLSDDDLDFSQASDKPKKQITSEDTHVSSLITDKAQEKSKNGSRAQLHPGGGDTKASLPLTDSKSIGDAVSQVDKVKNEVVFSDDEDMLLSLEPIKSSEPALSKGPSDTSKPARSVLDDLLGKKSHTSALDKPSKKTFTLDPKYTKKESNPPPSNDTSVLFGSYQPSVAASSRQNARRSVRFEENNSATDDSFGKPATNQTTKRSKINLDWLINPDIEEDKSDDIFINSESQPTYKDTPVKENITTATPTTVSVVGGKSQSEEKDKNEKDRKSHVPNKSAEQLVTKANVSDVNANLGKNDTQKNNIVNDIANDQHVPQKPLHITKDNDSSNWLGIIDDVEDENYDWLLTATVSAPKSDALRPSSKQVTISETVPPVKLPADASLTQTQSHDAASSLLDPYVHNEVHNQKDVTNNENISPSPNISHNFLSQSPSPSHNILSHNKNPQQNQYPSVPNSFQLSRQSTQPSITALSTTPQTSDITHQIQQSVVFPSSPSELTSRATELNIQQLQQQQQQLLLLQNQMQQNMSAISQPSLSPQRSSIFYNPLYQKWDPDTKLRMLETEVTCLESRVESTRRRYDEEIVSIETSFRNRLKVTEESYQDREKRWKEEQDSLLAVHSDRVRKLQNDITELTSEHRQHTGDMDTARLNEIKVLRLTHRQYIDELNKQHAEDIERIQMIKNQEVQSVLNANSTTKSIQAVMDHVSSSARDISNLHHKLDQWQTAGLDEREIHLRVRDEQLQNSQTQLEKQQTEMAEERLKLQTLIANLETQLAEQSRQMEQERFKLRQEVSRHQAMQLAFEEEKRRLQESQAREKSAVDKAKSDLIDEQKSALGQMLEERRSMADERSMLEVQKRLLREKEQEQQIKYIKVQAEMESVMKASEQERSRINEKSREMEKDEASFSEEWERLNRARLDLNADREGLAKWSVELTAQSEKVNEMLEIANQNKNSGEKALTSAKQMETEQTEQSTQLLKRLHELQEKEKLAAEDRLSLSKERNEIDSLKNSLLCVNCRTPVKDDDPDNVAFLATGSSLASDVHFPRQNTLPKVKTMDKLSASIDADRSVRLWRIRSQKDKVFLQDENVFLESLKHSPYH